MARDLDPRVVEVASTTSRSEGIVRDPASKARRAKAYTPYVERGGTQLTGSLAIPG